MDTLTNARECHGNYELSEHFIFLVMELAYIRDNERFGSRRYNDADSKLRYCISCMNDREYHELRCLLEFGENLLRNVDSESKTDTSTKADAGARADAAASFIQVLSKNPLRVGDDPCRISDRQDLVINLRTALLELRGEDKATSFYCIYPVRWDGSSILEEYADKDEAIHRYLQFMNTQELEPYSVLRLDAYSLSGEPYTPVFETDVQTVNRIKTMEEIMSMIDNMTISKDDLNKVIHLASHPGTSFERFLSSLTNQKLEDLLSLRYLGAELHMRSFARKFIDECLDFIDGLDEDCNENLSPDKKDRIDTIMALRRKDDFISVLTLIQNEIRHADKDDDYYRITYKGDSHDYTTLNDAWHAYRDYLIEGLSGEYNYLSLYGISHTGRANTWIVGTNIRVLSHYHLLTSLLVPYPKELRPQVSSLEDPS